MCPAVLDDIKERVLIGQNPAAPGAVQHLHVLDGSPGQLEVAHWTGDVPARLAQDDHPIAGFDLWKVECGAVLAVEIVVALKQLERRPAVLAVHVAHLLVRLTGYRL